jgi:prolipoprotein diacylglyceryltransferase
MVIPAPAPYFVAFALACLTIIVLVFREAGRAGLRPQDVAIAIALCALGGVLGSRYITLDFHTGQYGEKTFLGAVIGGLGTLLLVSRLLRFDARAFDVPAFPLLCGAAIGRMGCLLSGCCHGIATKLPWGVQYEGQPGPVHPTQLYEALLDLALALVLMRVAPRLPHAGERALITVAGLAVIRFLVDPLRDTAAPAGVPTVAQWTTLVIASAALLTLVIRRRLPDSSLARLRVPQPAPAWLLMVPFAALLPSGWLTPMEHALVLLTMLGACVAVVRHEHSSSTVLHGIAPIAGVAMLLQSAGSETYPRRFGSFGAVARGGLFFDQYSSVWTESEDCVGGTNNVVERRHSFRQLGFSMNYRSEASATRANGFALSAITGVDNSTVRPIAGELASSDTAMDKVMSGGSFLAMHDWRLVGFRYGIWVGSAPYYQSERRSAPGSVNDNLRMIARPAVGIRVGPQPGLSVEAGVYVGEPAGSPVSTATAGALWTPRSRQWAIRGGVTESGYYAGGMLVLGGFELEPGYSSNRDARQMLFGIRKRVEFRTVMEQ